MKKRLLLLAAMGVVLACSTSVFAASVTSRLQAGDCVFVGEADGYGVHAYAYGYVTIQTAKKGYDVTIQIWNAAPSYTYYAVSGTQFFGYLTTNAKGRGSLTVHVTADPGTWGNWIGLRQTNGKLTTCSDPMPPYAPQGLWAAPNPFNLPTP
jgi:hypothetical protein